MKHLILFFFLWSYIFFPAFSQEKKKVNCLGDTVNYVSLGSPNRGLGLGSPSDYSGFRLSMIDRNCITNGVSINLFSGVNIRKTNGLDIGLSQSAGTVNGVSIGLLGNSADYELNGLSFGTLLSEALNIKGVSITGGFQRADKMKGMCISGIKYTSFETYGAVISGLVLRNDSLYQGIGITALYTRIELLKGLVVSASNWSKEVKGVQIGLVNKTDYLKGVQVGLINYVAKNPRWARVLPGINFSLKIKPPDINIDLGIENPLAENACKNGTIDYEILKEDEESIPIISKEDSLVISFDRDFKSGSVKIYYDEELIFPLRNQHLDSMAFEICIKVKKGEPEDFIKIVQIKQKKCTELSWKNKYQILRLSSPFEEPESIHLTFTNKYLNIHSEE